MIIRRFSNDENPVEEVDLSNKGRMFELEVCIVKHPHRYPKYQVDYCSLAFCQSKDSAEKIMRDVLQSKSEWIKDIYCFNLYERVLDVMFDRSEYMSCWLYDINGTMIDKRTFPSYWSEGRFVGRSEDEIRFKFGDLVEEENGEPYSGDISDDTYIVIDGPAYMGHHMHVDVLSLFKPHFSIPQKVVRKFEKIWEGYLEDRRECYGDNPTIHQI